MIGWAKLAALVVGLFGKLAEAWNVHIIRKGAKAEVQADLALENSEVAREQAEIALRDDSVDDVSKRLRDGDF